MSLSLPLQFVFPEQFFFSREVFLACKVFLTPAKNNVVKRERGFVWLRRPCLQRVLNVSLLLTQPTRRMFWPKFGFTARDAIVSFASVVSLGSPELCSFQSLIYIYILVWFYEKEMFVQLGTFYLVAGVDVCSFVIKMARRTRLYRMPVTL